MYEDCGVHHEFSEAQYNQRLNEQEYCIEMFYNRKWLIHMIRITRYNLAADNQLHSFYRAK